MDELVGGAGLVLGHVLQVDRLLQEDLPLDPSPVVSLDRVDHLDAETQVSLVWPRGAPQGPASEPLMFPVYRPRLMEEELVLPLTRLWSFTRLFSLG